MNAAPTMSTTVAASASGFSRGHQADPVGTTATRPAALRHAAEHFAWRAGGAHAVRSARLRSTTSSCTARSLTTRARHGGHARIWISTVSRSAPASSPSTYGVTRESIDEQLALGIDRLQMLQPLE